MQGGSKIGLLGILITSVIALMLVFSAVQPAQAAVVRGNGLLNANETIDDDLIISGNQVRADGTVNGMLIAAGQTVTVNGTINGDALLFGQSIIVSDHAVITGNLFTGAQTLDLHGKVTGSIAAGASSMTLAAAVGRNVYYGGYSLETDAGSSVGRGLYMGGYQAILKGNIARELRASAGAVDLDGAVGGDAQLDVAAPGQNAGPMGFPIFGIQMPPSIPTGLRVGPNAKINGKLVYTSQIDQASAIQAAPAGGVVFQTPTPGQRGSRGIPPARPILPVVSWFISLLRNFITLLLLGLLAVWLLPAVVRRTNEIARARPVQSAGYGLVTIIIGYAGAFLIALIILALGLFFTVITLGGLSRAIFGIGFSSLAVGVTALTLLVSYISKLVVAYLADDLILSRAAPSLKGRQYWAMGLGVLIYAVLASIPFIGWLIGLIVTLIGMGAIWLYYQARRIPSQVNVPAT